MKRKIQPKSRSADIYGRLRDAILAGELLPGSPLSRRSLAQRYAVSTLPVAEALRQLESEGLVESRPRAGTRVRIPLPLEIQGHYQVREALETQAARLFAERASVVERRELLIAARVLDDTYAALALSGYDRRTHARAERRHFAFHLRIARATGCKELVEAIERSRVLLMNWLFMMSGDFLTIPERWHGALAEALVSGDVALADGAMRHHVRYRQGDVEERFAKLFAAQTGRDRIVRGPQSAKSAAR